MTKKPIKKLKVISPIETSDSESDEEIETIKNALSNDTEFIQKFMELIKNTDEENKKTE